MASSARTEQWIFTGGRLSSSTICVFLIAMPSSSVRPLSHSVASELDAIALPAAEALELGILDLAGLLVHLDLELHHIAALGARPPAHADVLAGLDLLRVPKLPTFCGCS
jgi:hypothetical protein